MKKKTITIKKEESKSINDVLAVLAIAVVCVAFVSLVITFIKISDFNREVTGWAATYGYVNISVNTTVAIDANPNTINWSIGFITPGLTHANLTTYGPAGTAVVSGGNWSTAGVTGINISNRGNTNCTLKINGTKNYTDWFGVTAHPANYSWNISNNQENSCSGGDITLGTWIQRNHTEWTACSQFGYLSTANTVWLNVQFQVPSDAQNVNTPLSEAITITCS
ncbi:MAG: hypothetical protein QXW97_01770 [Candidatus Pacearchaeota archaeon]